MIRLLCQSRVSDARVFPGALRLVFLAKLKRELTLMIITEGEKRHRFPRFQLQACFSILLHLDEATELHSAGYFNPSDEKWNRCYVHLFRQGT